MRNYLCTAILLLGACESTPPSQPLPDLGGSDQIPGLDAIEVQGDLKTFEDLTYDLIPSTDALRGDEALPTDLLYPSDLTNLADTKPSADQGTPPDLKAMTDGTVIDQIQPADLLPLPDLLPSSDLVPLPDLLPPSDLALYTDLLDPLDMIFPSDHTPYPDLLPLPDLTPTCTDGVKNGMETDTDCGGGTCPGCLYGKACLLAGDCAGATNAMGTCPSGTCKFACNVGYSDCDLMPGNGCEVNLLGTDAANCGSCGHNCSTCGGTCVAGVCQSVLLATMNAGVTVNYLASNTTNVYFTATVATTSPDYATYGTGYIAKMNPSNGTFSVMVDHQTIPWTLVLSSSNVYWTNTTQVQRIPLTGGTSTLMAWSQGHPQGIVLDSSNVYWLTRDDGKVRTLPLLGSFPETVLTTTPGGYAAWIAQSNGNLYFSDGSAKVYTVPTTGGTATIFATGEASPDQVVTDSSNVYWNVGSSGKGTVRKVSQGGGTPTDWAPDTTFIGQMAIDSTHIYWVWASGGGIHRKALAGGNIESVGTSVGLKIAVDNNCLYATDGANASKVYKVTK